jgi:3-mercaptopyruvate sulfurtransferase SseA
MRKERAMKINSHRSLFAILLAATLFAWGCDRMSNAAHNNNANGSVTASAPVPETPQSSNPEDKMPRVKVQDALKEFNDGTAVIIDVRGTDAYKMAHIKGALDIHLQDLEAKNFKGLPKDKRIIAYCT